MTRFRVLFVCIGNVCRSPVGERLLAKRLPSEAFEVSSAGVGAAVGSAMTPEAAAELEAYGGSPEGFVARQLEPEVVADSDLVLTATRAVRSRVLEDTPGALWRTFTVLEFAALLDVVHARPNLSDLVRAAAEQRSRADLAQYDIADPYGQGDEAHAEAARVMAVAVDRIAEGLVA